MAQRRPCAGEFWLLGWASLQFSQLGQEFLVLSLVDGLDCTLMSLLTKCLLVCSVEDRLDLLLLAPVCLYWLLLRLYSGPFRCRLCVKNSRLIVD